MPTPAITDDSENVELTKLDDLIKRYVIPGYVKPAYSSNIANPSPTTVVSAADVFNAFTDDLNAQYIEAKS